ncbi:hypothetical protein HY404_00770 [Candidatus Microgenomates bacterium]|nr:hypothetical protein [Candidatus Microgenomates bacterium]
MKLNEKTLFLIGLMIPAILVFRSFFTNSPLVWGDAPFFYSDGLKELQQQFYVWVERGNNFGGPNLFLSLYPLMFIYGFLHNTFGLSNDFILRILFYFPSVILAFIGPIILTRYLKFSPVIQFFSSLLYGINTYNLLLIDGGQVGVSLAYGLFPLSLFFLHKLISKISRINFLIATLSLVVLTICDLRIALIAILTVTFWKIIKQIINRKFNWKIFAIISLSGIVTALINLYWLIPLSGLLNSIPTIPSNSNFISLLDTLLIFQPHFPSNEFGKISPPPFYFIGLPLLIFAGFILTKTKRIFSLTLCFLLFAFLAKGSGEPLGEWYLRIVNLPFGIALRDATKFFAPLLIFAGILLGNAASKLSKMVFGRISILLIYLYLLFLVYPALTANLNGVLGDKEFPAEFYTLVNQLKNEAGFYRTIWFPERHPFVFQMEEKPALDAKDLVNNRPFASINIGTFDHFNFLNNSQFLDWFNLLGIHYLIFSGEQRKSLTDAEKQDWSNLLKLTANVKGLEKINISPNIPLFKLNQSKPHIFAVPKLIAVVGSDDIYEKIKKQNINFSVGNQAFIFVEDGKFDPKNLINFNLSSKSVNLVFNDKQPLDLTMSLLQRHFISPVSATKSEWAIRENQDYLKWKYELLTYGMETHEFNYGKGIAFSTVKGERIYFDIKVPKDGDYILAVRSMSNNGNFKWQILEETSLKKGNLKKEFINSQELEMLNILALVPKKDFEEAENITQQLMNKFTTLNLGEIAKANSKWLPIEYQMVSSVKYEIKNFPANHWLIFTDSYHPQWQLVSDKALLSSWPIYSMINGFYINGAEDNFHLKFIDQEKVELGAKISMTTLFLLVIICLLPYDKKEES